MQYIHLPLKGAYNVRDLGGYAAYNGSISFNTFLRGDSLENLTDDDIELLKNYGIKNILDLRGDFEVEKEPDKIIGNPDFEYKQISLFGGIKKVGSEDITKLVVDNPEEFLMKVYVTALTESKSFIKEVLDYMAQCEGGILFHCTGGKDRTGIISALLLGLVGVKKTDIIANYEVTFTYLNENPQLKKDLEKYSEGLIYSKPAYIANLLNYIDEHYTNTEEYLKEIGVNSTNIEKLKNKLIG